MLTKKYFKTKGEYEVTFTYTGDADTVELVTEANGWTPIAMKKGKNGFTTKVRIPANGQYQFLYLVNGIEWVNDDAADAYVANEHGTENGVVETAVN